MGDILDNNTIKNDNTNNITISNVIIDESTKLQLISGMPISVNGVCEVHPLKISEISELKYENYQIYLSNMIAEPKDYFSNTDVDYKDISSYDVIVNSFKHNDDNYKLFITSVIETFLKESVYFLFDECVFGVGDIKDRRIINNNIFEEIKRILKLQNCIKDIPEEKKPTYQNERQKDVFEKIMAGRKRREQENAINFVTIYNSVVHGNKSFVPYSEVNNLTVYQLYNTYESIFKIETYQQNFKMLLAGAKSEDLDLKHWSQAIKI